jgi:hypothetical protein
MTGINRLNNLNVSDFNRVAQSDQTVKLSSEGTVVAKSNLANKIVAFFKPEKARRENQQATATFVASITRSLANGAKSGIFSRLEGLSPEQKEAVVANLLNYKDASGKGILDDQLKGAKPLTGRKVAQVLEVVGKQIHELQISPIKNKIDELVSASNDLQPQADRLRFGKLRLSDDGKAIEASISTLVKDLSDNVRKLKGEVVNLGKQREKLEAGPQAQELDAEIAELKEYVKSGELTIRDLKPEYNRSGIESAKNVDTRALASSISYLAKKEPLPEGRAIKSALHKEKRVDKGDTRTYFETDKTRSVRFGDQIQIGIVGGHGTKDENEARLGEHVPYNSEKAIETELRKALKDLPEGEVNELVKQAKFQSEEVQDIDPNAVDPKKTAKQEKVRQANIEYGIKTDKPE